MGQARGRFRQIEAVLPGVRLLRSYCAGRAGRATDALLKMLPTREQTPPDRSLPASLLEWLWGAQAMKAVQVGEPPSSPEEVAQGARARLALEVGDRAFDPVEPFRAGSGAAFAIEAYRQAIYWSLGALASTRPEATTAAEPAAQDETKPGAATAAAAGVVERFRTASGALRGLATECEEGRREAILARTFAEDAAEPLAALQSDAVLLRELATALVSLTETPGARRQAILRRRALRLALVVAALLLGFITLRPFYPKSNLAAGKPWKASSTYTVCDPAKHSCGGATDTDIFFHTLEDDSPWVEIDLGEPTRISEVTVRNRTDCCTDRALPLVVEVASEPGAWKEVARRTESFGTWEPTFKPVRARYVRLRVPRKTFLHLVEFSIHR
jgi:hypothetical protein